MTALADPSTVAHLSYSAAVQYLDCPERFRLERIERVRRAPTWWFVGGDAFHRATELLDLGLITDANTAWQQAWGEQIARLEGVDLTSLQCAGRPTADYPRGEDDTWWVHHGPQMVARYLRWRCQRRLAQWTLLNVAGVGGVEVPFRVTFGDVPVQGVIDRVWMTGEGDVVIVDYKAGRRTPDSTVQLKIYAEALLQQYGIFATKVAFYMAREGALSQTESVGPGDAIPLVDMFAEVADGVREARFPAIPAARCSTCPVRVHCPQRG